MITAAEARITVVELDLAGCLGRDGGDVILAGRAEGSIAGAAACGGEVRSFGVVVGAKRTGAMLGGTSR